MGNMQQVGVAGFEKSKRAFFNHSTMYIYLPVPKVTSIESTIPFIVTVSCDYYRYLLTYLPFLTTAIIS